MAWIHENNDDDDNLEVLLLGSTKVPLFSKVNNRNSGSRTFSALLTTDDHNINIIFWTRIMATMILIVDDANDDAIVNQISTENDNNLPSYTVHLS